MHISCRENLLSVVQSLCANGCAVDYKTQVSYCIPLCLSVNISQSVSLSVCKFSLLLPLLQQHLLCIVADVNRCLFCTSLAQFFFMNIIRPTIASAAVTV